MACATSSARCSATSTAVTCAPRCGGDRAEQRGLAAGPGAQVEPAPVGAVHRRLDERGGDQLGALVLHVGAAVADRGQVARRAAGEVDRVRRERARAPRRPRRPASTASDRPGPGAQVHRPPARCPRSAAARCRRGRRRAPRRTPARSTVDGSARPRGARPGRSRRPAPAWRARRRGRLVGDLAQHRVGEAGRARRDRAHQVDRGRHRRVRRHPGVAGAGRRRAAARRGPAGRCAPPPGRPRRPGSRRACRWRAACRRSARWRTRRRGRAARARAGSPAGPGWRTRRRGARRRPPRTRPAGPGRRPAAPDGRGRPLSAYPRLAHANRSVVSTRTPRAQSGAGIAFLPAARTSPSATGVVAVPTSTRRPARPAARRA